jgi:flagellar biosynthesis GTPase FlhF
MSTLSTLLNTPRPTEEQALGLPESDGRTRLYRGRSIDELIPRIEAELGIDAIVVRRKRGLEGGIGGFFQRPFVEIEAKPGGPRIDMYDEGSGAPALPEALQAAPGGYAHPLAPAPRAADGERQAHAPARSLQAAAGVPQAHAAQVQSTEYVPAPLPRRPVGAYLTDTLASIAAAGMPEPTVEDPPPVPAQAAEFRELTPDTFGAALAEAAARPLALESEIERIEDHMGEVAPKLSVARPQARALRPRPTAPDLERARASIEHDMTGLGVSEEMTQELIDSAIAHAVPFAPRGDLDRAVHRALVAQIPANPLLPAHHATVAVVGPGGSGKTSCCAAVLGAYRRAGVLPASCASIMFDVELGQPTMLLSPHIMEPTSIGSPRAREVLADARRDGLLLLDMPALSPAERPTIQMVAGLLQELAPDRVVVALPATLGARAAEQLLEALRPLQASGLAITHADETDQLGVAVEAACRFGLAPEYLLDRGRVRGGLTRIDPTHLADRLIRKSEGPSSPHPLLP